MRQGLQLKPADVEVLLAALPHPCLQPIEAQDVSDIIGLITLFLLALIVLSALKGAAWLEDPDPERTAQDGRAAVLADLRAIEQHRPSHIVSTADSEAVKEGYE